MEHWLADEPVGAYTEPPVTRAKRWMRKHPSRVTAAAVLLLATIVGLAIGAALLEQSRRLGDEQRRLAQKNFEEAETQRKAADAMFRKAKSTVDTYLTKVSEERLLKEPRLQPLRKELLKLALDYYLDFIKDRADEPSVRKDLADAHIAKETSTRRLIQAPTRRWEANAAENCGSGASRCTRNWCSRNQKTRSCVSHWQTVNENWRCAMGRSGL